MPEVIGSNPHSILKVVDLPAPLGPEQAEYLRPADGEADAVHSGEAAEPPRQVARLDNGVGVSRRNLGFLLWQKQTRFCGQTLPAQQADEGILDRGRTGSTSASVPASSSPAVGAVPPAAMTSRMLRPWINASITPGRCRARSNASLLPWVSSPLTTKVRPAIRAVISLGSPELSSFPR